MNSTRSRTIFAGLSLAAASLTALSGCALLGKSEPLAPRYFSPERPPAARGATVAAVPVATDPAVSPRLLKLGSVVGGADLRTQLAFRTAEHELGYDEEIRWTEEPEVYLRRALSRALFEERGLAQVISGPAPTLEVELVAFEERTVAPRTARVMVVVRVHDDRTVQLERSLTVDVPLDGSPEPEEVVAALSEAMYQMADQVAALVIAQLAPQVAALP